MSKENSWPLTRYELNKYKKIVRELPDNLVEWQKQCVCDFESNNNTHSNSCKERFEKILEKI